MELAQLKYFQVMANIRHFTRAARMLDVTQPALSRSQSWKKTSTSDCSNAATEKSN